MHLKHNAHDLHESNYNKDFTYVHTHTRKVRWMCMRDATVLAHMLGYYLSIF
jgi:hypothetical protein